MGLNRLSPKLNLYQKSLSQSVQVWGTPQLGIYRFKIKSNEPIISWQGIRLCWSLITSNHYQKMSNRTFLTFYENRPLRLKSLLHRGSELPRAKSSVYRGYPLP